MTNIENELQKDNKSKSSDSTDDLTQETNTAADKPTEKVDDKNQPEAARSNNETAAESNQVTETKEEETDPKDIIIKELEEKNKEINDKYFRLFSEFDNFRKRMMKEKLELTKTASADMVQAVLPVLDDLERAEKAAKEDQGIEILIEGVNLIHSKLKTTLKQKGLEEIPTIGMPFNTDFHEAITNIPSNDEQDKGKIVEEVQKGYTLNGKILRFAKVVVAN